MRSIITFFLFLCCFNTYAQKEYEINDLIVLALNKAVDTTKIFNVQNIIASKKELYNDLFDYVPSINPLNPKRLKLTTSKFGRHFHSVEKKNKAHLGLDFSAENGTTIHATAAGNVIKITTSNNGYGNQVIIKHDYGFSTSYAQMHKFIVKKGDTITKGQIIGYVNNADLNTVPFLHYEILKNNKAIDPYPFCFLNLHKKQSDSTSSKSVPVDSNSTPVDANIDTFLSQIKKNRF